MRSRAIASACDTTLATILRSVCAGALIVSIIVPATLGGEEMTPLRTPLPKPIFSGTPNFLVSPNLEAVSGRLRQDFLVPEGTTNLSAGRPVKGSDPDPFVGQYAMVTDGDKEGDGDSFLEIGEGLQWVQIDLGRPSIVHAILLWHYHSEARIYHDVVIQLSSDASFREGVVTVFNNDHDNSSGMGVGTDKEYIDTFEGRLIPVPGVVARYVRLYSNGNTSDEMNDYVEAEVWGREQDTP